MELGAYMHRTRMTSLSLLLLATSALVGCSGSASSGLAMPPAASSSASTGSDAGATPGYPATDGAADTQAASPSPPGPPLVGRGDNFSPDSGLGVDAPPVDDADASDAGPSSPPVGVASGDALAPGTCPVSFTATNALVDGLYFTSVVLGGDAPALGSWDPAKVVTMTASLGVGVWTSGAMLPAGTTVHFKFGMMSSTGGVTWESAPTNTDRTLLVTCDGAASLAYVGQYNQVTDAGP
jgi:hypothetical protein